MFLKSESKGDIILLELNLRNDAIVSGPFEHEKVKSNEKV